MVSRSVIFCAQIVLLVGFIASAFANPGSVYVAHHGSSFEDTSTLRGEESGLPTLESTLWRALATIRGVSAEGQHLTSTTSLQLLWSRHISVDGSVTSADRSSSWQEAVQAVRRTWKEAQPSSRGRHEQTRACQRCARHFLSTPRSSGRQARLLQSRRAQSRGSRLADREDEKKGGS